MRGERASAPSHAAGRYNHPDAGATPEEAACAPWEPADCDVIIARNGLVALDREGEMRAVTGALLSLARG